MANLTINPDFGNLDDLPVSEEDLIKVLIATDIHLGYEESTKRNQTDDSFRTFEEILQNAVENDVDMILLGGDLFHDTKPSQVAVQKCLKLIRQYCFGQKNIKLQFLSNPEVIFSHCTNKHVNYEDSNLNIKIPIFTINGNHDDPTNGIVGSIDVVSASGFVNYFGKSTDVNIVRIPPLVFRKGESTMALHGLSFMNEQRLSRLFRDEKVKFYDVRNNEGLENCYQIFVLHQNRVQHGANKYIPENAFPDFINLVIWGHEHECLIDPMPVEGKDYYIVQPGSSVATSLCAGEEESKHVALLYVHKDKYKLRKIKLKTVRPFVFRDIILREEEIKTDVPRKIGVYNFISDYIEYEMIPEATKQFTYHPMQPQVPLLRLRVIYDTPDDICDVMKLSKKFVDSVANYRDIIKWKKSAPEMKKGKKFLEFDEDDDLWGGNLDMENDWHISIQQRLESYFNLEQNKDKLQVLSIKNLNLALTDFIEKDNLDAFGIIYELHKIKAMKYIAQFDLKTEEEILEKIVEFRNMQREATESTQELQQIIEEARSRNQAREKENEETNDDSSEEVLDISMQREFSFQSRARGNRSTRGRGRGSTVATNDNSSVMDIDDNVPKPSRGRGSRARSRAKTNARTQNRTANKKITDMFSVG